MSPYNIEKYIIINIITNAISYQKALTIVHLRRRHNQLGSQHTAEERTNQQDHPTLGDLAVFVVQLRGVGQEW